MKKADIIDHLKGFSILTIVIMHLIQMYMAMPNIINKAASLGGTGVHIFIICSGFGLYYSYLNKPTEYTQFLKKRLSKIYIPYIIIIFISFITPIMYSESDKVVALLSHVFLFKMFIERYESSFGVQFWFISTIIQFYLIFDILVKTKNNIKNDKKFFLISLIISFTWWIIVSILGKSQIRVWNSFVLQYLWEFVLGMILANIYYDQEGCIKMPNKGILILFSVIGLLITGITGILGGMMRNFNDIPAVLGYGSLAILIYNMDNNIIKKLFINISKISYEWYLVHILVFSVVFNFGYGISKYIISIIAFFTSIIVAKIYSYIISKLKFKNFKSTFIMIFGS